MPDMGTFVERFPRVVSERALRDGAKPELVDLIVKTYDDHGDTHALADVVNYRGGGPVDFGLARQSTHYIWTEPKSMLEHMPLIGHIQAKFYEMTDDGGRVLDPVRPDRPGAHRGRLRRLPVQRVRGQPAHPGRLPGRQRRAGPPPARHVRPPARRDHPEPGRPRRA